MVTSTTLRRLHSARDVELFFTVAATLISQRYLFHAQHTPPSLDLFLLVLLSTVSTRAVYFGLIVAIATFHTLIHILPIAHVVQTNSIKPNFTKPTHFMKPDAISFPLISAYLFILMYTIKKKIKHVIYYIYTTTSYVRRIQQSIY